MSCFLKNNYETNAQKLQKAPGADVGDSRDDFGEIFDAMNLCDCSYESQVRIHIVGELGSTAHSVDLQCFGTICIWVIILLWGEAERSPKRNIVFHQGYDSVVGRGGSISKRSLRRNLICLSFSLLQAYASTLVYYTADAFRQCPCPYVPCASECCGTVRGCACLRLGV